jgi:uncharacterized protein YoxC
MTGETFLMLVAIALLLVFIAAIPLMVRIGTALRNINRILEILNQSLPQIMKNLEEITTNISDASALVRQRMEDISLTLKRIQSVFRIFIALEQIIRGGLGQIVQRRAKSVSALAKGLQVFVRALRKPH